MELVRFHSAAIPQNFIPDGPLCQYWADIDGGGVLSFWLAKKGVATVGFKRVYTRCHMSLPVLEGEQIHRGH